MYTYKSFLIIFLSFTSMSYGQKQKSVEFNRSLFTKGYLFSNQLTPELTFKKGLMMVYNGDYNTLSLPAFFSQSLNDKLIIRTGFDITTQLNANNILLPVNTFGTFDVNAQFGGSYNFDGGAEGHINIQQRLFQINGFNSSLPSIVTKPINLNMGLKF